ncbi:response regulator transcription factor [Acidaminobacter sp. JC074]|uniref:response regulator transcription factor n=1 Tax=Acidaminobacter sp. JC074 TaxID=2530199 RepID=UPI001F0EEA93|nr:response regulator transcription factor [Acidaminobacter sp. JC074]MCH4889087.1 response regulator transcription factor [Acidaminobacter sp. JC074]
MRILVCDDDVAIVGAIEIYLKNEGYDVIKAYNGQEAIDLLKDHEVHLIIMDIMMPYMDGLNATHKIREKYNIPVIMLSAKSEDMDKIMGLNMGADDYLTKPFNPLELIARVRSQLRRYTSLGSIAVTHSTCQSGGLVINDETKEVTVDGEKVKLTRIEYNILHLLLQNAGMVFSIDHIYESVWNEPAYQPENTVAVHIRRIREKIEIDPKNPKYLKVVWGVGYKIEKH